MPILISIADDEALEVNLDEFYRYIETNSGDVQTYWIDPDKTRGRIVCAAIDYAILLPFVVAAGAFVDIYSLVEIIYKAHKRFFPKEGPAALYIRLPDGTEIMEKKDKVQVYMRRPDGTEIMLMKDDNGQLYERRPERTEIMCGEEDDGQFCMRRPDGTEIMISGKKNFVKELATSIIDVDEQRVARGELEKTIVDEVLHQDQLWSRRK